MVFILLLITMFNVYAIRYNISADKITTHAGEKVSVPVKISENSGMMGFKISVEYPVEVLSNPMVSKGAVTAEGMFNSSITEKTAGSFDIVWNYVSNVKENGVIFILQFDVSDVAENGNYPIKLTYSQPDTFNEAWEDVVFSMSDIIITVDNNVQHAVDENQMQVSTDISQTQADKNENSGAYIEEVLDKVDSDYLQGTIEDALENVGAGNIASMDENQLEDFESYIDDALSDYGVETENRPENKDAYEEIYNAVVKDNFIGFVTDFLDEEKIVSIIDDVLDTYGVKNIEQLDDFQKENFVKSVVEKLIESGVDINNDFLNRVDSLQVVKDLYKNVKATQTEESDLQVNVVVYVIFAICAVALIIVIALKCKNTRRKNNENSI